MNECKQHWQFIFGHWTAIVYPVSLVGEADSINLLRALVTVFGAKFIIAFRSLSIAHRFHAQNDRWGSLCGSMKKFLKWFFEDAEIIHDLEPERSRETWHVILGGGFIYFLFSPRKLGK